MIRKAFFAIYQKKPLWLILLFIVVAAGLNGLFSTINAALSFPFFFDSIWTATIAALFGPVVGVATGILTNFFLEILTGFTLIHYPFGLCNALTGLIVGLMARSGRFRTVNHIVIASLAVTLGNSILGAVIATYLFGGATGIDIDYIMTGLMLAGQSVLTAAFWARIPANLVDKTVAVLTAFLIFRLIQRSTED